MKKTKVRIISEKCIDSNRDNRCLFFIREDNYCEDWCKFHDRRVKDLKSPCKVINIVVTENV